MVRVNFIPASRRIARRRRALIRAWGVGVGAYALAAGAASAWLLATAGSAASRTAEVIADLEQRIAGKREQAAAYQDQLKQREAVLRVNLAIADQPDWSILLALLAARRGEGIALESCALQPVTPAAAATGAASRPASPTGYRLALRGLGRRQSEVSEFVLSLERTGLFASVKLLETRRTTLLAGEAIAFTVECELQESREAAT